MVVSPDDYPAILEELHERNGELCEPTLWRLAKKAFALTAAYDRAISTRLARVGASKMNPGLPAFLDIRAPRALDLRYGENPHQKAALYSSRQGGIAGAEQLQGKELSYNNLVDLDAAWQLIREFEQPAAAIIKHTNPCGCAEEIHAGRKLSAGVRSGSGLGVWRRAGIQSRCGSRDRRGDRQDLHRSDCRARLRCRRARIAGRQEEPAIAGRISRAGGAGGEIDQRRLSGADAGHAPVGPRRMPGEDRTRARRKRNGARSSSPGRCANT